MKRFDTVEQVAKEMNLPVDKVQGTFNDYMEIVKDPKKDPFGKKLYIAKNRFLSFKVKVETDLNRHVPLAQLRQHQLEE